MASNLFVNRLYVLTELNQVAYDERFHHGVNIIRGDNSSGKSTVAQLVFYALGGEYTRFVDEARRCSRVLVEVSLGGATVTLERPLDKDGEGRVKPRQGMTIHWGTMPEALDGHCRRLVLGYAAGQSRQSFSAVLFRLMDMPAVQAGSAITMHQLLRLMYVDQESPTWSLFMHEQFDRQETREAVADLLMGIYDASLYGARLELRQLEADMDEAKAVLYSLKTVLPEGGRSRDSVNGLIGRKEAEIERYARDIARLREGESPASASRPLVEEQKATVASLARECSRMEEQADLLEHEVQDTRFFIDELTSKRAWLMQSAGTRRALGSMRLDYCPECLSPLPADVPEGTCCLCKSRVEGEAGLTQARRMAEDLALQIQEFGAALRADEERLASLKARLRASRRKHRAAQGTLDELLGTARPPGWRTSTTARDVPGASCSSTTPCSSRPGVTRTRPPGCLPSRRGVRAPAASYRGSRRGRSKGVPRCAGACSGTGCISCTTTRRARRLSPTRGPMTSMWISATTACTCSSLTTATARPPPSS